MSGSFHPFFSDGSFVSGDNQEKEENKKFGLDADHFIREGNDVRRSWRLEITNPFRNDKEKPPHKLDEEGFREEMFDIFYRFDIDWLNRPENGEPLPEEVVFVGSKSQLRRAERSLGGFPENDLCKV
jgi:hypothetical protein